MCSYIVEKARLYGTAKGPGSEWMKVDTANVYYDHPYEAQLDHALCVDFVCDMPNVSWRPSTCWPCSALPSALTASALAAAMCCACIGHAALGSSSAATVSATTQNVRTAILWIMSAPFIR